MEPKVSVIVPVYNSEKYLAKTIRSLLGQTYANKEIIIVDDSSMDGSFTIAKAFESEKIKIVRQPNGGAACARNTGLAMATGKYIQFMDADDLLSADKIEKQVAALETDSGKVAVCNYREFNRDEDLDEHKDLSYQDRFIFSSDKPAEFLINLYGGRGETNFIQTNCWLVPMAVIEKSGGWRNYRCPDDDGEFFARVLLASSGIVYTPGVINYYRKPRHNKTLSGNSNKKYLQNTLLTIDLKKSYLQQYSGLKNFNRAFAAQYFEFAVYNYPSQIILSKIAEKRFKQLNIKIATPMLGSKAVMFLEKIVGWKIVRLLRYYLTEKKQPSR